MNQIGVFHDLALEVMADFRRILKRYYAKDERDALLAKFDLKRKRAYDADLELFQSIQGIQHHLMDQIQAKPKQYYAYSGIEQYYAYLQSFLNQYYVSGRKVEHKSQRIWRVMLDIIQLVTSMTEERATQEEREHLKKDCIEIASYGNQDQKIRLSEILTVKAQALPSVFADAQGAFARVIAANKHKESAA